MTHVRSGLFGRYVSHSRALSTLVTVTSQLPPVAGTPTPGTGVGVAIQGTRAAPAHAVSRIVAPAATTAISGLRMVIRIGDFHAKPGRGNMIRTPVCMQIG